MSYLIKTSIIVCIVGHQTELSKLLFSPNTQGVKEIGLEQEGFLNLSRVTD